MFYFNISVNEFDLILSSCESYTCKQLSEFIKEYKTNELQLEKEVQDLLYYKEADKNEKFENLVERLSTCDLLTFLKSKKIDCINKTDFCRVQFFERNLNINCNHYKGENMNCNMETESCQTGPATCCGNPRGCTQENIPNCNAGNCSALMEDVAKPASKSRFNLVRVGLAVLILGGILFAGFYFDCPLLRFMPNVMP